MTDTAAQTPTDTTAATDDGAKPGGSDEVLAITETAREKILELRSAEDDAELLGLHIAVTGASGIDYTYDLAFEPVADQPTDAWIGTSGSLPIIVPVDSIPKMRGATLDLPGGGAGGGLVLKNPNRPELFPVGELELSGDIAEKVQQLLDSEINPGLASHGGFASLKGVKDDRPEGTASVYVLMGGGCQGCSMSRQTLTEGIATAIRAAIPEVSEVVDVTDHAAGETPYFS